MAIESDDYSFGDRHHIGLDHLGSADRDMLYGFDRAQARCIVLRVSGTADMEGQIKAYPVFALLFL